MTAPLSDEALAGLLAKADKAAAAPGVQDLSDPRGAEWELASRAFEDACAPSIVAALVREVQMLRADRKTLMGVVVLAADGYGRGGCVECGRIGHHHEQCQMGMTSRLGPPGATP